MICKLCNLYEQVLIVFSLIVIQNVLDIELHFFFGQSYYSMIWWTLTWLYPITMSQ